MRSAGARVILGGLAVFVLASVGCALSRDLPTLLAFRALQGLSAGVGLIVGRAVIRDVLHGDDAQRLMSQVSMIFGIAPAIAPIIGGWILGWSALADDLLVPGGVLAAAVARDAGWRCRKRIRHRRACRCAPRRLLRDYVAIFLNPRFQRLAAAGTFNFGALFLYIASAPAFVLDFLHLNQRSFALVLRADDQRDDAGRVRVGTHRRPRRRREAERHRVCLLRHRRGAQHRLQPAGRRRRRCRGRCCR